MRITQLAAWLILASTAAAGVPDIYSRLAQKSEARSEDRDGLQGASVSPEPRRIKVDFSNGRGEWDAGYGRKYDADGRLQDGDRFPFVNGGPNALEYRDGWMYYLETESKSEPENFNASGVVKGLRIDFYHADWCGPCQATKPAMRWMERQGYNVVWHNVDQIHGFQGGIPYVVVSAGGKAIYSHRGLLTTNQVRGVVSRFREQAATEDQTFDATPASDIQRGLALLPTPKRGFVDIGCGEGDVLVLAGLKWGKPVIGYEIDESRVVTAANRLRSRELEYEVKHADATKLDSLGDVDVGYAYLFPDVLSELRPLIEQLDAFVSYKHAVPGLAMRRSGDFYVWTKPHVQTAASGIGAWYGGNWYTPANFRRCGDSDCGMCNYIYAEWRRQGWRG